MLRLIALLDDQQIQKLRESGAPNPWLIHDTPPHQDP